MSNGKSNFSLSFFAPSFEKFKNLFKNKSNETHTNEKSKQSNDFLRHESVKQSLRNSYYLSDLFSVYSTNIQPCNLCSQCLHFNHMINNQMQKIIDNRRLCSEFSYGFVEDSGIQDIDRLRTNYLKNKNKSSFDLHSYKSSRRFEKQQGILIKNDRLNSVRSHSSGRKNDLNAFKSNRFCDKTSNSQEKSYLTFFNSKSYSNNHHMLSNNHNSMFFVPQKSFKDTTPVVYNFDQYGVNTDFKTPHEPFKYSDNHSFNSMFHSLRNKKSRCHERHQSREILNADDYHMQVLKLRRAYDNDSEGFWLPIHKNISDVREDDHDEQLKNCYETPSTSSLSLLTPKINGNKSPSLSSSPHPFHYPHHKSLTKQKTSKSISSKLPPSALGPKGVYLKGLCKFITVISVNVFHNCPR